MGTVFPPVAVHDCPAEPEAPPVGVCHAEPEAPLAGVSVDFAHAVPVPMSTSALLDVLEVHRFPTPSPDARVGARGVTTRGGGGGGGGGLGEDVGFARGSYPDRPRSVAVAVPTGGGTGGGGAFTGSFAIGSVRVVGGADPEMFFGGPFVVGGDRERLSA